ncbi:MAG: hypothetical protein IPH75_14740 [bacterium]|nr:hypothetical protein [bacterium]
MVHRDFDPATLTEPLLSLYRAWADKISTMAEQSVRVFEQGGRLPIEDSHNRLWGEFKELLLEHVFHGHCAYCESPLSRQSAHAEHFRPKGKVTSTVISGGGKVAEQQAIVRLPDNTTVPHPGYFWLDLHWRNLLPACEMCNTGRGKRTRFPVARAHAFIVALDDASLTNLKATAIASNKWHQATTLSPEDLDDLEGPLLHPFVDNPEDHIDFDEFGGVLARCDSTGAVSIRGQATIETLDLGAEKLRIERRNAIERALCIFEAGLRYEEMNLIAFNKATANKVNLRMKTEYFIDHPHFKAAVCACLDRSVSRIP